MTRQHSAALSLHDSKATTFTGNPNTYTPSKDGILLVEDTSADQNAVCDNLYRSVSGALRKIGLSETDILALIAANAGGSTSPVLNIAEETFGADLSFLLTGDAVNIDLDNNRATIKGPNTYPDTFSASASSGYYKFVDNYKGSFHPDTASGYQNTNPGDVPVPSIFDMYIQVGFDWALLASGTNVVIDLQDDQFNNILYVYVNQGGGINISNEGNTELILPLIIGKGWFRIFCDGTNFGAQVPGKAPLTQAFTGWAAGDKYFASIMAAKGSFYSLMVFDAILSEQDRNKIFSAEYVDYVAP